MSSRSSLSGLQTAEGLTGSSVSSLAFICMKVTKKAMHTKATAAGSFSFSNPMPLSPGDPALAPAVRQCESALHKQKHHSAAYVAPACCAPHWRAQPTCTHITTPCSETFMLYTSFCVACPDHGFVWRVFS